MLQWTSSKRQSGTGNRSRKFEISAGALVPGAAVLVIGVSRFGWSLGVLAAVLIVLSLVLHEAAHIVVAHFTGTAITGAGICLKGPYLRRKAASTRRAELCVTSAGLAMNALIFIVLWNSTELFHWLAGINLYFAACNLIPLGGSDGQRILALLRHPQPDIPQPVRRDHSLKPEQV